MLTILACCLREIASQISL
ncbi:hypothetical protein VTP21DRAFT_8855 [Calcarisporiella thermophila]